MHSILRRRVIPLLSATIGGATLYALTLPRTPDEEALMPSGFPSLCCAADAPVTSPGAGVRELTPLPSATTPLVRRETQDPVVTALEKVIGPRYVLTGAETAPYTTGARLGRGTAVAVALPATIEEAVAVLQACVDAGVAVIPQGRNTGLTGGSVPRDSAGRPFVIISTRRLDRIVPLDGGKLLLALGGAGISDAATAAAAVGRESHSVLGSFFMNPTVSAGVALGR